MANTPIAMNKLRIILRLFCQGKSKRFIASYLGLSRLTVRKYISQFIEYKLTFDQVAEMSDKELYDLFQVNVPTDIPPRLEALLKFFPRVEKELKRPGVTRLIMWKEYIALHPDGYGKTSFYSRFKKWIGTENPSMHIDHKAGDKLYIDYAGKKLEIIDCESGEITQVQVFVAILGASQLIYVEATYTQQQGDLITSVENALYYFDGAVHAVVPDNLKSAVKKSHRYEPTINEAFKDFCDYYGMIVLPARAYKPKDKALVEGAVKIVYSAIYSPLRNKQPG